MSKKIDPRLPADIGGKALPQHGGVKTPWEKVISFYDASHYTARYTSMLGAVAMQAYRILEPDYAERSKIMCKLHHDRMLGILSSPFGNTVISNLHIHPFCKGNFIGGMYGDTGDEDLLMCGRVNDFGTYRVEKELDICDWDIVGSELCRATVVGLQAISDGMASHMEKGVSNLEYNMVEAKGCGDLHCRVVAESRERYPREPHEQWESFGPAVTSDQIKFTAEEDCIKESMIFREECGYRFHGPTCEEKGTEEMYNTLAIGGPAGLVLRTINGIVEAGRVTPEFADHVLRCVAEAAGKAMYAEHYAKKGLRDWLGVPDSVHDGREMGAHIEVVLQCLRVPYEIEAFNKDEVIYLVDRAKLRNNVPRLETLYLNIWYGMVKTLVNAQWSLWEEDSPEGKIRIKIARKIDKFC